MNIFSKYLDITKLNYKIIPLTHLNIEDSRNELKYQVTNNKNMNILFIGGDNKIKGLYNLINVLEEIKHSVTNWKLFIYGSINDDSLLKLYGPPFYNFKGTYKQSELDKIFSNTDLFIMPSLWKETYGFVALEAYSYGIPIVLSDNVGFSMIIKNNITGFIYKNANLKSCLVDILKNQEILNKIHYNIVNDNNFDNLLMEKHVIELKKIYNEI